MCKAETLNRKINRTDKHRNFNLTIPRASELREVILAFASNNHSISDKMILAGTLISKPALISAMPLMEAVTEWGSYWDSLLDNSFDRKTAHTTYLRNKKSGHAGFQNVQTDIDMTSRLPSLFRDILRQTDKLDPKIKDAVVKNVITFTHNVLQLDLAALTATKEDWTYEFIKKYREAVNFQWAKILISLSSTSEVSIGPLSFQNDNPEHIFDIVKEEIAQTDVSYSDNRAIMRLFLGSMCFQVISDVSTKDQNTDQFIPSFGYESVENPKQILESYIEAGAKVGLRKHILKMFIKAIPSLKKMKKFYYKSSPMNP